MPVASDTRVYTTTRLPSNYGYNELPIVDDTLPSRLPLLVQRTGRLIQIGRQLCELWSPNSTVHPYLPGVIPKGFNFSIPDNPCHRRFDGHLGRFDYTVVPQMFSEEKPWRGFIRRPSHGEASADPEFAIIHQIWKPLPSSPDDWPMRLPISYVQDLKNRVTQLASASTGNDVIAQTRQSVWENRPELPTPSEIDQLGTVGNFDTTVDLVLEVQRRIRDFDAWHRYIQMSLNDWPEGIEEDWLRDPQFPANDEWIGAWINGAVECDVLRALYWRMPCFIAHVLSHEEQTRVYQQDTPTTSLTEGTDAAALDVIANGYDFIAKRSLQGLTRYAPTRRAELPDLYPKYRLLSASTVHGWTGRWYSEVKDSRRLLKLCPPLPLPPWPDQAHTPPIQAPEALPLGTVILDEKRVPWIRPPPVMQCSVAGKLSHWIEGTADGKDGMKQVSKSKDFRSLTYMYDRQLKRKLYFTENLRRPAGAVSDHQIFGMPVPPLLFLNSSGKQVARSTWVYHSEKPDATDIGRLAPTPVPSDLPLLTSVSAFSSMELNGGEDDDDYVPEEDDMTYILPKYTASMFPARPVIGYNLSNSSPSHLEHTSMESIKLAESPINTSVPVTALVEKHQESPIEAPVAATDLTITSLFSTTEVESTDLLREPEAVEEVVPEGLSLPSSLLANGTEPTSPQAIVPMRKSESQNKSMPVEQFPLVGKSMSMEESTPVKETMPAEDAAKEENLLIEVVESRVNPMTVGESSSPSSLPVNKNEYTPAQALAPARNPGSLGKFILESASVKESPLAQDKFKDDTLLIKDCVVEPIQSPSISANEIGPTSRALETRDLADGAMRIMEATPMEGAFLPRELSPTWVVGIADGGTSRPMDDSRPLFSSTTDQNSLVCDDTVSLGSSPQCPIDYGPELLSPLPTINLETTTSRNSTYLCVSSFRSNKTWQAFLANLRDFASRRNIGVIEVLRSLEGEGVHLAWISVFSEDDTKCTRGYYMGTTFQGSNLDVHFVEAETYFAALRTAAEIWRSRDTSTAPVLSPIEPSQKRGRSLSSSSSRSSSRSQDSYCLSGGLRTPSSQRSCPPKNKRRRVNDHSDHQSHLFLGNHARNDGFVYTDNRRVSPRRSHRSPSPTYSQFRSRTYRYASSSRHVNRSISPRFGPEARRRAPSPQRYRRSPSPTQKQGLQSRNSHYSPPPRRYCHSPFPTHIQESQLRGRNSPSPSRYRRFPPPLHDQGFRSRGRYDPSPLSYHDPPSPTRSSSRPKKHRHNPSPALDQRPGPSYHHHYSYIQHHHRPPSPFRAHWDLPSTASNTSWHNCLPAAAYDPFGSYLAHTTPSSSSYQLTPDHCPPPSFSQQVPAATLQPPLCFILPAPGPSGGSRAASARTAANPEPHMFERMDVPLHERIQTTYRPKNRRKRGRRKGAQKEDQGSDEGRDQVDHNGDQFD